MFRHFLGLVKPNSLSKYNMINNTDDDDNNGGWLTQFYILFVLRVIFDKCLYFPYRY